MSTDAIVMMVVVLGAMWGGFITMLTIAMRQERNSKGDILGK